MGAKELRPFCAGGLAALTDPGRGVEMRPEEGTHRTMWRHQDRRIRGGNCRPHLPLSYRAGRAGLRREDVMYVLGKEGSRRPHQATLYLLHLLLLF